MDIKKIDLKTRSFPYGFISCEFNVYWTYSPTNIFQTFDLVINYNVLGLLSADMIGGLMHFYLYFIIVCYMTVCYMTVCYMALWVMIFSTKTTHAYNYMDGTFKTNQVNHIFYGSSCMAIFVGGKPCWSADGWPASGWQMASRWLVDSHLVVGKWPTGGWLMASRWLEDGQ